MEHDTSTIEGVTIKKIVQHRDERGYFAELVKEGEPGFHTIEQTSYAITLPGVIKAFHYHDYFESWVVLRGRARVVIHDTRANSKTKGRTQVILASAEEPVAISIPPRVAHGYQVLGTEPVGMLYHAEEAYDPAKKDQIGTMPFDSKEIGFDWSNSADAV